jgi:hypothetical protein
LTRTFYEESAAEEEDRRRRRGHGDSAEDNAEAQEEGTQRRLLWMMPLSPSRTRSAGLLQRRLSEGRN